MIRLQSISINHFRGIREGVVQGLTDVNLLVGRNNSGKTTVVEAITRCATQGGLAQDLLGRNPDQLWQQVRSAAPVGGVDRGVLWYRQDTSKEIVITGQLSDIGKDNASDQHPGSLERFATALCKAAKTQSVQLLISTHSAECVRSFLKGAKAGASEAAVFHLTLADGKLDSRRLDPEAVETLMATGVDVRWLDLYA